MTKQKLKSIVKEILKEAGTITAPTKPTTVPSTVPTTPKPNPNPFVPNPEKTPNVSPAPKNKIKNSELIAFLKKRLNKAKTLKK